MRQSGVRGGLFVSLLQHELHHQLHRAVQEISLQQLVHLYVCMYGDRLSDRESGSSTCCSAQLRSTTAGSSPWGVKVRGNGKEILKGLSLLCVDPTCTALSMVMFMEASAAACCSRRTSTLLPRASGTAAEVRSG